MKINAVDIEIAVHLELNPRKNLVVPNVSWGLLHGHEADLLVVYPSGWMSEVEIKVTAQDIKADTQKRKWVWSMDPRIHEFWFAVPEALKDHPYIPEFAGIFSVYDAYDRLRGFIKDENDRRISVGSPPLFENGFSEKDYGLSTLYYYPTKVVKDVVAGKPNYRAKRYRLPKKLNAQKITAEEVETLKRLLWLRVWTLKKHLALEKQKNQELKARLKKQSKEKA